MSRFFSSYVRPIAVFGLSFMLIAWGTMNIARYNTFVAALQHSEKLSRNTLDDVLAETDSIEELLITFNYETVFEQPVEFLQDITAPNILYSLTSGDGISLKGDAQKPTITNTGVLSVNGLKGEVTLSAGENVTFVEENGVLTIKSTDTNTDTKLSESEVEAYVFDGENTGSFTDLEIDDILLSATGTTSTTSGSSLVGVYQGNLTTISGTNVQDVINNIDSTLSSLSTSSHAAVTFAGSLDYLTLTGQEITLNQIDLTTDVTGNLPVVNGGTGASTAVGARNNLGLGTSDTVSFGRLGVGTTNPPYPLSIVASNPNSVTMSMQNTSNTGFTSIRYLNDAGTLSASFGYGNTGASKFKDIAYIQTYSTTTPIALATNSTDRIFITGTGDVGIGTTTPSAKLHVEGDIVGTTVSDGTVAITGGNITGAVNITAGGIITGTGSGLSGLNASNLSSGTVPSARISGSYTGIAGVGTISTGTWQGSAISSTYLDTNVILSSEIDTSAEIEALISGETGSGALVFGTSPVLASPTFTGNVYFPGSGIWNSTGSVGIGTTNPGATLDVQGAAQFGSGNVDLINSTGKIAAINTTYFASVDGSALTNLNASNLASGTVASARISGSYTGITGVGTIATGTWQGTAIASTYLDTNVILSTEIDTSAEIAAIVTNETGSGALVFGTSPSLTTPNIGAANGTSLSLTGTLTTGGIITGTGSGLSGLNASNLSSGTVASARVSGSYTGITGTGALNAGSITSGFGNINIGTSIFTGNGSGLTSLSASNLSSGTVPDGRITGTYTGLTSLTGSGTSTFGSYLLSSNGSRTAPVISWSSDTNMGIYRGGTDILRFATAGSDRVSILAGGNVGIGTTNPSYALQVNGYTRFDSNIGIGMDPASLYRLAIKSPGPGYVPIYVQDNDSLNYLAAIDHEVTLGGRLGLWDPSGVQQVTINGVSSFILGNVAVGKSYASSFSGLSDPELFDVDGVLQTRSGTIQMGGDTYRRAAVYTGTSGDPYFMIYLATSGTSSTTTKRFEITSSGNIGIDMGVSTPSQKLDVNGNARIRTIGSSTYANVVNQTSDGTLTTATSDIRFKKNIVTIDNALEKVMKMRGVTYNWIDSSNQKRMTGMIAQEVLEVMPELVVQNPSDGYYGLFYGETAGLLVEAIKEQQSFILTNQSAVDKASIKINEMGEVLGVVVDQNEQLATIQNDLLDQISLVINIQDAQNSSTSASLQKTKDQVKAIEDMTYDINSVILGLQDRISQLESIFAMQTATDVASLDAGTSEVLGVSDQLDLTSLTVTGDTNINNLGVTGDITAGLLSIKGFDDEISTPSASISTISGPLKIQDQAAGNLEIMGGKVFIDTDGNIVVRGSMTVDKLNIDEKNEDSKSTGEGIITSGNNEVIVKTTAVTNTSRIFVTGKSVVKSPLTVTDKIAGESFTVHIAIPEEEDIEFDWLIVN